MAKLPTPAEIESVADLTGIALFQVDADQNLIAVSPEMERLTGFARDEVLGRPCLSLVRCPQCLKGCGVFERGEVHDAALTLYRKNGDELRVLKSGRVLRGDDGEITGAVESVRVVGAPDPVADSRIDFDGLFEGLGRMVLTSDCRGRVVAGSASFAALAGLDEEELPGCELSVLFGDALFGPDGALTRALESGERREGWRAQLRHRDGTELPVSLSAAPVPDAAGCSDEEASWVLMLRSEVDTTRGGASTESFQGMVSHSPRMREIFRLIELLRGNDAAVLIDGESGTGKELVARAIHRTSHRSEAPFVAVNCAAIPSELMESELFGHVKGAFTGAVRDREGRFQLADGGTLFLDEIGDLPLHLQGKLLRAIQEQAFERVGESRTRRVDVRVIAATNRDLAKASATGTFREDLYYRLRVIPIHIPPLRSRREDIAPLLRHALDRMGHRHHRALRLSPSVSRALLAYDWPGNVRELENVMEYATAVCEGQTIHVHDLPPELTRGQVDPSSHAEVDTPHADRAEQGRGVLETIGSNAPREVDRLSPTERLEAARILEALQAERFHRERAAARLGISRTTLWRKVRQYGL